MNRNVAESHVELYGIIMRLLNARTLEFEEFYGDRIPKYAILSHTWEQGEVTFQDWQDHEAASRKAGYVKVRGACQRARRDGLDYVWVDTNCIDKSSSAELTEAINSMFAWYRDSVVCYAYLVDVPPSTGEETYDELMKYLRRSRWFTRGWTLQELLAPSHVIFFASDWARLGERTSKFANDIADIAGIDARYLTGESPLGSASIATKMYWLSQRVTSRIEDIAYCMLGLFDINMPLLYGEGSKAFSRLQEEIIKVSNDHTIFCWTWTDSVPRDWASMLAPSPEAFKNSRSFVQSRSITGNISTYSMTNAGLSIRLPIIQSWSYYFVVLNAGYGSHEHRRKACIPVSGFLANSDLADNRLMQRAPFPKEIVFLPHQWAIPEQHIFVRSRIDPLQITPFLQERSFKYGMLVTVGNTRFAHSGYRVQSSSAPNFDQVDPGSGFFLVERAKRFVCLETSPPDLFDKHRSMFLFNYKLVDSVYGGLLHFGQLNQGPKTGLVVFFAIKVVPGSRILWFCQALHDSFWGLHESKRRALLQILGKKVASRVDDQLFHESKSVRATAMVTEGIEWSGCVFRVAHIFFGLQGLKYAGEFLFNVTDDGAPDSDDDSVVPAAAHWKPAMGIVTDNVADNMVPPFRE
jgi:hypothetical protein